MRLHGTVPAVGAFAEMSSDAGVLVDVIASSLAAEHTQFFFTCAVEARGMYKQRIPSKGPRGPPGLGLPPA